MGEGGKERVQMNAGLRVSDAPVVRMEERLEVEGKEGEDEKEVAARDVVCCEEMNDAGMSGRFEDAGFTEGIMGRLALGGRRELDSDELVDGGIVRFIDGGEET